MTLNATIARVTDRIRARSADLRGPYLERMQAAALTGPARGHLACAPFFMTAPLVEPPRKVHVVFALITGGSDV